MHLESTTSRPLVGLVVMVDVYEQEVPVAAVDDQPDVAPGTNRPEVRVSRLVDPVKLQARMGRVRLQVERRRLDRLLLVSREAREAIGERVGNPKKHQSTRKSFITSSPRWLITFTAIRPEAGLSNGREISLFSDAQASGFVFTNW